MAPTILTLPLELRLMIYGHVMCNWSKEPQLPCCQSSLCKSNPKSGEWQRSNDKKLSVPRGARDMVALGQVNHQFSGEVQIAFYSKVKARLCSHYYHSYQQEDLHGLGHAYSAYEFFRASNTDLQHSLQNFTTVELHLPHGCTLNSANLDVSASWLINTYFNNLDNCRLVVEALNASRCVKTLHVAFRCTNIPMEASADFEEVLGVFEKLHPSIRLELHIDVRGTTEFSPIDTVNNNLPTQEHLDYVHSLQKDRSKLPRAHHPAALIDEWIHLRSWLFSNLPQLRLSAEDEEAEDLDMQLQMRFAHMHRDAELELRDIVKKTWRSHNKGDVVAFKAGKGELLQWWNERCSERNRLMMQGTNGPEPVAPGAGWSRL